MDVRGPARSRRKRKEPIGPQEILAWFNLAQTLAEDKSILGGLINTIARGNREEAIAARRMGATPAPSAPGAAPLPSPAQQPVVAPQPEVSPVPQVQQQLPQGVPPEVPPMLAREPAVGLSPTTQQMQQRVASQAAARMDAPRSEPTFEEQYRQAVAIDQQMAREQAQRFAAQRALTYEDLAGMAASAESGEALRAVLRMVPQVMKSDPALAPRSLSDLLFGGGVSSSEATNQLIGIFLKRQGREKTPQERMLKMAQAKKASAAARQTETLTPVKEQRELATTHRIWGGAELDRKRGEMLDARRRKYDREHKRRRAWRKSSGGKWWGNEKEAVFTDYGLYLDAMKSPESAQLMVPSRFMKGGQPMGMSEAQQSVYKQLGGGRSVKTRVNDLLRFHHRGVTKPKKSDEPSQQQQVRRKDTARQSVTRAHKEYNLALGVARGKDRKKRATALGQLDALFKALEQQIANAKKAGVVYTLTGVKGGDVLVQEAASQAPASGTSKYDIQVVEDK